MANSSYPKTLPIKVTATDIRLGRPEKPSLCPIARATTRTLKGNKRVFVDGLEIEVRAGRAEIYYSLTKRAQKFVERFDARKSVKPFEFRAKLQGVWDD